MRNKTRCAAIILLVGMSSPSFAANVVGNPGFESGDFNSWTVTGVNSSPGENGIFYGVDTIDAHSGNYGAYFGPVGGVMSLSQAISTVPGVAYTVSFWLAQGAATSPPYVNSFSALFGGNTLVSQAGSPASTYTEYGLTSTPSTTLSTLVFNFRNDLGFFALDDISVSTAESTVPEPSIHSLFALGCLSLIGAKCLKIRFLGAGLCFRR